MLVDALADFLQNTAVSLYLQSHLGWLWPLCETLHFIGLALLVGATGFFDLRLLGFMKRVPIPVARSFLPLGIAGFGVKRPVVASGLLDFINCFMPRFDTSVYKRPAKGAG